MTTPRPLTWHVLGGQITQTTELAPNGTGLTDVYVVPYQIDSGPAAGHTSSVKVPISQYSRETVTAAIAAQAAATHDVAGLSG